MTSTSDPGDDGYEYEFRETTTWDPDHGIVPVLVRLAKPRPRRPLPPLPDPGSCTRNCPEGECYCGEPLVSDFLFPDGDEWGDDE
jgi:hypothetical protein